MSVAFAMLAVTAVQAATKPPSPSVLSMPNLQTGNEGTAVTGLQSLLVEYPLNYKIPVTRVYDEATRKAVMHFQHRQRLKPTGIVDRDTWLRLMTVRSNFFRPVANPLRITKIAYTGDGFGITVRCPRNVIQAEAFDLSQLEENPPRGTGSHANAFATCRRGKALLRFSSRYLRLSLPTGSNIIEINGFPQTGGTTAETFVAVDHRK